MNRLGRVLPAMALLVWCGFFTGCESGPKFTYDPLTDPNSNPPDAPPLPGQEPGANLLHVGDTLIFNFTDTPTPISAVETVIKDDGSVTLLYNQRFDAAGKTVGALQNEIRDRYVPHYFKFLTITIKTEERFFSVGGQVRAPNRVAYATKMTLLQAINTAGGFTDFAKRTKVKVTRSDHRQITVDCIKAIEHPELDIEIFPGDTIYVPKRIW